MSSYQAKSYQVTLSSGFEKNFNVCSFSEDNLLDHQTVEKTSNIS